MSGLHQVVVIVRGRRARWAEASEQQARSATPAVSCPDVTSSRELPGPHPSTRLGRVHQVSNTTTMLPTDSTRCRELEHPDIANFSISV